MDKKFANELNYNKNKPKNKFTQFYIFNRPQTYKQKL